MPTRRALASGIYGSVAGLRDAHYRRIAARATPHPYATFISPVRSEGPWPDSVQRAAILCMEGGLSIASLRRLVAHGDPLAVVLGAGEWWDPAQWTLHELPTGHWALFSMPEALADLLQKIAAGSRDDRP